MEQLGNMIPKLSEKIKNFSYAEFLQLKAKSYNSKTGNLTGYDCEVCKNKGYIEKIVDDVEVLAECKCLKTRDTLRRIKESGLGELLRCSSFRNFNCYEPWVVGLKERAKQFLESESLCLFLGGQSGCGKTHLCTAVIGGFIKKGKSAQYLVWREDSPKLKSLINDREYTSFIDNYKKADVLYIDDLFMQKDRICEKVTDADVKLAFELIDYRARNKLITIISTNFLIGKIIDISEPLGSRIFDMAREFCIDIPYDKKKNYRLRKE